MVKLGKETMATINSNEIKKGASINSVKSLLVKAAGSLRKATNKLGQVVYNPQDIDIWEREQHKANQIVTAVKDGNFGFASEIAATVAKYGKISEKQAYWIARTAWEKELPELYSEEDGSASYLAKSYED